jgi:hypothetical protein
MTLQTTPDPLSHAALPPGASRQSIDRLDQSPWWKIPMVWVVISGPLSVVIASLLTAVIAWRHIDPVIIDTRTGAVIGHAGDEVAPAINPKDAHAPAQRARNHSATPNE